MSEGLLEGALGEEEEDHAAETLEGRTGAEAFAAAIAAIASRQDPAVARETELFLVKQSKLLDVQTEHLEVEHELHMESLRAKAREARLRRVGMRLRIGFQILVVALSAAIGVGLVSMVKDAVTSHSVVIDPFDTPPTLAGRGISGKVVAAGLLDVLTKIQAANRSGAERRALSNAWTGEISVEIPETGLSVGQIERILKDRFGHDQHVEGDLVTTGNGGLALTVRGNGILPKTFDDDGLNLEKVLTQAGEYVYGQSQPGLWAAYLTNNNRADEAIAFAKANYRGVEASEKPYVLNYWADAITVKGGEAAITNALPLYREAVRLKPDYWAGYANIMFALAGLGDEEGLVRTGEHIVSLAGGRPGLAPENAYLNYDQMVWDLRAERAAAIADAELHGGIGTNTVATGAQDLYVAQIDAQMHDVDAARFRINTTTIDAKEVTDVAAAAIGQAYVEEEVGDLKAAAREWDAFALAYGDPTVSTANPQQICFAAVTYELTGQAAKADAALKPYGDRTFTDCYRFKGDVLDLRGDWAGAQDWYAKTVKLGPSIPSGYYSWGVALVKHGDVDGAAAKFADANRTGPHWADPLKAWGDVLVKRGKFQEALAKYDEALKYAPNWKQLKEARFEASHKRTAISS